jgi:hypothetical protein
LLLRCLYLHALRLIDAARWIAGLDVPEITVPPV